MSYQKEWLLLEANDEIDEVEHRNPSEEYQFYHAVASGNVDYVRRNCESGRFSQEDGVGQAVVSRSRTQPEISPCHNYRYDYPIVCSKWYGVGAGFSPQRFLYSKAG